MNKLLRFWTLIFVMALMLPSFVMAATFKYNYRGIDFRCKVKDGQVSIISFDRNAAKVVIPAHVQDKYGKSYPVSMVNLFDDTEYKTSELLIEKEITEIAPYCFYLFSNLNVVYIPSTIEKVGKKAFNPKHAPSFKMPPSINEEDLRKGLAIYPKAQTNDAFQDIDFSDYAATFDAAANEVGTSDLSVAPEPSKRIADGTSDVDYNIPTTSIHRDNTFCVIIANEAYAQAPKVDFAAIDGATFKRYCQNTLGLPAENIHMVTNANYLKMQEQFDWLEKVSEVFGSDANFIVYYAGHGIPSEDGSCYLLPVDGNPTKANNGYSLKKLYDMLGRLTTQSALVLIDACFSGNARNDVSMLGGDRGVAIRPKNENVTGNVIVMSAASNTETALPYEEKGHGMFTYFLLKKLQETKGKVTYGELYDFVHKQVMRRTTVSKSKTQTPSISFSGAMSSDWKNKTF